jgi:hypothetical protein
MYQDGDESQEGDFNSTDLLRKIRQFHRAEGDPEGDPEGPASAFLVWQRGEGVRNRYTPELSISWLSWKAVKMADVISQR